MSDGNPGSSPLEVALLTGGDDRSYALGLTAALVAHGVKVDFVGSDKLDAPELHATPLVRFLNLRGDQREDVGLSVKVRRLLRYYFRLLAYAVTARPRLFHILWHNKFEAFDRTLLLLYYRALGRRLVFTAHNVNAAKRDGCDSAFNRFTLRVQYRLMGHIFVHTERMKQELLDDFNVSEAKVSVIPFGINNTTPITSLTRAEARGKLGLETNQPVALFFGQIAPYKGLEYLLAALPAVVRAYPDFRLVIAGKVKKGNEDYWRKIERQIADETLARSVVMRIEHIPDIDVEIYFKAADALVIPYVHIFQSGVPFLAYSFGLPVVATDVGSLREDIIEGQTGMICRACDAEDLGRKLEEFFRGELGQGGAPLREAIRTHANERHSWLKVGAIISAAYRRVGLTRSQPGVG